MKTIHTLYDDEIVSQEAIEDWFHQKGLQDEEEFDLQFAKVIREKVKPLIEWLNEDSDEEESE